MDKETLSNYGWIVICVLVLAVMLALATPFGTFVADGFKATYTGLFQTGDSALDVGLNAVGVSNKLPCGHGRKETGDHSQKECGHYNCDDTDCGCVPASCGVEGHWSGDGLDHTTKVNHTGHTYACQCVEGWTVPEGGTYTVFRGDTYSAGETLPCGYSVRGGDSYTYGDYNYFLHQLDSPADGWKVKVLDKTKIEYGPILSNVCNLPVTQLYETFRGCTSLTIAPEFPSSITTMYRAFASVQTLTSFSFPSNITSIGSQSFHECDGLTSVVIPDNITNIEYQAFAFCDGFTDITIPNGVQTIGEQAFYGCGNLKKIYISESVTSLGKGLFCACKKLTTIEYGGNIEQWNAISKGDNWNYDVPATYVQCSDGQVSLK